MVCQPFETVCVRHRSCNATRAVFFNTPWRFDRDGQGNHSGSGGSVRRGSGRVVGAVRRRCRRRVRRCFGRQRGHEHRVERWLEHGIDQLAERLDRRRQHELGHWLEHERWRWIEYRRRRGKQRSDAEPMHRPGWSRARQLRASVRFEHRRRGQHVRDHFRQHGKQQLGQHDDPEHDFAQHQVTFWLSNEAVRESVRPYFFRRSR